MKTVYSSGILLVAFIGAACSSDSTGPSAPEPVIGSYALQTINGDTVPTLLSYINSVETDMISDVYTFNSDQTFSEQIVVRVTQGSSIMNQSRTSSGTYAQHDASLTISPTGGTTEQASVSGDFFTVTTGTSTQLYHKNPSM
jgi:hypothetical protein